MNNSNTDEYKNLDKEILELYNSGLSNVSIAERLVCSTNTVWRHLKKHSICRIEKSPDIDWIKMQSMYDSGMSEQELRKLGLVCRSQLDKAKNIGKFKPRILSEVHILTGKKTKGKIKHTQETKDNLSKIMTERHANGTAYTLGHNEKLKKRSYPEQWFESVINDRIQNKRFESQYRFGRYCLDFAWITEKKCVEVDGETHYRFQSEIDKDIKRDQWIEEQGWSIIRFRWKDVISDKEKYISDLKKFIDGV